MARLLVNLSSLSVSRFAGVGMGAVLAILAGRVLGPTAFGQYALVMVLVGYFAVLIDFGMSTTVVRGIAGGQYALAEIIGTTLVLRGVLFVASAAILALIAAFWKPEMALALAVGGGILLADAMYTGFDAALRGAQEMVWLSITEVVFSACRLAFGAFVLLSGYGLIAFLLSIVVATVVKLALVQLFFQRLVRCRWKGPSLSAIVGIVRESRMIAAWQVLSILYIQMNVPVLSFAKGDAAAGHFKAGASFVDLPLGFITISISVFLPALSALYAKTPEKLEATITHILKLSVVLFVPVYLCVAGFGSSVVLLVFGGKYTEAGALLPILFVSVLTAMILGLMALVYIIQHRQHVAMRFTMVMILVKGVALAVAGSFTSIEGLCAVIVLADVVNIVLHIAGLRGSVRMTLSKFRPAIVALASGAVIVLVFYLLPQDTMLFRVGTIACGIAAHLLAMQCFGVVDIPNIKKELRLP
jgi:O-antigen/teichoic acid export membrane protein